MLTILITRPKKAVVICVSSQGKLVDGIKVPADAEKKLTAIFTSFSTVEVKILWDIEEFQWVFVTKRFCCGFLGR